MVGDGKTFTAADQNTSVITITDLVIVAGKVASLGISSYASYIHAVKVGSVVTIGNNYFTSVSSISTATSNAVKRTVWGYIDIY